MKADRIVTGIIAHVDSGKTTLAESLLYKCGIIKRLGRVDHKDAYLDTNEIERERGITIFSKQADIMLKDKRVTLLDTPGHVDFSAETERALLVMDYVILVINASEGIQSHVLTLWKLLSVYKIPVFIFVNKMDMPGVEKDILMPMLKNHLSSSCVDFSYEDADSFYEEAACGSEDAMTEYFDTGAVSDDTIKTMIADRQIYPCFFGSALRLTGVEEFMDGLNTYMELKDYPDEFGARIYKISRDNKGARLTHMKICGGSIKPKMLIGDEKINQIRMYSGDSFENIDEAYPGMLCAVTGLTNNKAGEGLGITENADMPCLAPVLIYRLILPDGVNVNETFLKLKDIEEEEPQLSIVWNEKLSEINVRLMGEIQTDVLKRIIRERLDIEVGFDSGSIVYKETLAAPVEGVGHYEPLRHYAEVHILMEPLEAGSGIVIDSNVSEDILDRNWQRLIMTNLEEKKHIGVLTGSEITDIKIMVINGRAHLKHTEGGDFREAAYRAVRHGLMRGKSILLEPVYNFRIELPAGNLGRALNDISQMCGNVSETLNDGDNAVLIGTAPVSEMQGYQSVLASYTKGLGSLGCSAGGYAPCHNADEVIEKAAYDPVGDIANPPASIFCSHGAGFYVPWEQVEEYMHIPYAEIQTHSGSAKSGNYGDYANDYNSGSSDFGSYAGSDYGSEIYHERKKNTASDEELDAIFERTFGPVKRKEAHIPKTRNYNNPGDPKYLQKKLERQNAKKAAKKDEYLLVDGYNIIFAWDDLKKMAENNLESARVKLMEILCNYQGYIKCTLIVVFDAYRVKGNPGSVSKYNNIYVVYTKEAETADQYIEKTVHKIGPNNNVTVATSDALEQVIIFGAGAARMSAAGLRADINRVDSEIRELIGE